MAWLMIDAPSKQLDKFRTVQVFVIFHPVKEYERFVNLVGVEQLLNRAGVV